MKDYWNRIVDRELELRLEAFGATLIVGPKWCGKTTTAEEKAKSVLKMQDPDMRDGYLATAKAKPSLLLKGENPRLIDEWQEAPVLWDAVRTAVDDRQEEGLFILTGSTSVDDSQIHHSGTGRISRLKMYPMSLYESRESNGSISLKELFEHPEMDIDGIMSDMRIEDLIFAACRGGWPSALRKKSDAAKLIVASDYLKNVCEIDISTVDGVRHAPRTLRYYLRHLPFVMRVAAFALMIVALARPQGVEEQSRTNAEGIDIMLSIDISGSMLARDFKPDRISAATEVAASFVADRVGDRIGLAVFAGEAFTQSPLTTDKSSLQTLLARIRSGVIEDGTAIGNGLATAINRLRESDSKSKVVILLTDGVNNRGEMSPLMAADIAADMGIRVYTIGVGTRGKAPYPALDMFGNMTFQMMDVEIDEETLSEIASRTGGKYFRATDKEKLKAIYDEINQLEKTKVEITDLTIYHEEFLPLLLLAMALLLMEFLFAHLILKRIP